MVSVCVKSNTRNVMKMVKNHIYWVKNGENYIFHDAEYIFQHIVSSRPCYYSLPFIAYNFSNKFSYLY